MKSVKIVVPFVFPCLYYFYFNVNPIVLFLLHCFNPSCLQVYKEIKMLAALA